MNFKKKILTVSFLAVLATPVFCEEQNMGLKSASLEQAQALAKRALDGFEPPKSMSNVNLGNLPNPSINYDGMGVSQIMNDIDYDNFGDLNAINPKKKLKVFVSFSMPEASIKRYITQAERLGSDRISIVVNGIQKHETFPEGIKRMGQFVKGDVSFELDPPSFERFGIDKVPAIIVYTDDPMFRAKCSISQQPELFKKKTEKFLKVFGDVPIDFALERLLDKEPEFDEFISEVLNSLKGDVFRE